MSEKAPHLFPVALGNEEETFCMTSARGGNLVYPPTDFVSQLHDFLPTDIKHVDDGADYKEFLQNGAMVYDGSVIGGQAGNLERATPECSSPAELATYVQVNETLLVNILKNYIKSKRHDWQPEARAQRRVVDANGNTRASHDNFENRNNYSQTHFQRSAWQQILVGHLGTRSLMTGAGYMRNNGYRYAQKVEHLVAIEQYGYVNSAYRVANEADSDSRIEVRCNDINISPWAAQVRPAITALLLGLGITPLRDTLAAFTSDFQDNSGMVRAFKKYNVAVIDNEGNLRPDLTTEQALSFQQKMLELFDEQLGNYLVIPQSYQELIREAREYCDDFAAVLHGEGDLELLADRADWATKLYMIRRSIRRARDNGIDRSIGDITSIAQDIRYDNITVKTGLSPKQPTVEYGPGYRWRERNRFRMTLPQAVIEKAYYLPPDNTRAHIRGTLIRQQKLTSATWNTYYLKDEPDIECNTPLLQRHLIKTDEKQ